MPVPALVSKGGVSPVPRQDPILLHLSVLHKLDPARWGAALRGSVLTLPRRSSKKETSDCCWPFCRALLGSKSQSRDPHPPAPPRNAGPAPGGCCPSAGAAPGGDAGTAMRRQDPPKSTRVGLRHASRGTCTSPAAHPPSALCWQESSWKRSGCRDGQRGRWRGSALDVAVLG